MRALDETNAIISTNVRAGCAHLADFGRDFHGNEMEFLCYDIEPSLKGAAAIANLFKTAYASVGRW
jgi:hypothetical protein